MVRLAGLEPAIPGSGGQCSIQLSHRRVCKNCNRRRPRWQAELLLLFLVSRDLQPYIVGNLAKFFPPNFLQVLRPLPKLFIEADRLILHFLVGLIRPAEQVEVCAFCVAHVPVLIVEPEPEKNCFALPVVQDASPICANGNFTKCTRPVKTYFQMPQVCYNSLPVEQMEENVPMSKKYIVAVVGIGMVGKEMLRVLHQRNFPAKEIRVLATRARSEVVDGRRYDVIDTTEQAFDGVDVALFAGTEGEKGAAQKFGWLAVQKGAFVVDNGGDFRMDPRVPLVVPEVNADAMRTHQGFIANPNCSTIQMVVALAPLHRAAGMKRVVATTFQAVSGTGRAAVTELETGVRAVIDSKPFKPEVYPHPIPFNVLPQIGSVSTEFPGYYTEEVKMVVETRKIFDLPNLAVTATCVRVPVMNAHSEAVNVEFERPISADEARRLLAAAPGVTVIDEPANSQYPLPKDASGKDPVFVGRIREDKSVEHGLALWVVADNIRKGAALNAVQIVEEAIEMKLI